jgi:hypothetical protein
MFRRNVGVLGLKAVICKNIIINLDFMTKKCGKEFLQILMF